MLPTCSTSARAQLQVEAKARRKTGKKQSIGPETVTKLSPKPELKKLTTFYVAGFLVFTPIFGLPGGTRTPDLRLRRPKQWVSVALSGLSQNH
jgi:hypothetical protein